jgi:CIC family chloride channel protein
MTFETAALPFTLLAAIVAYVLGGWLVGFGPLFRAPTGPVLTGAGDLAAYVALGVASGVVGAIVPTVFYRVRDAFHALPVPPHVKPAIGGLAVGSMALALPQVLGGGYYWIQQAIDGRLDATLLGVLMVAKVVALSLTISSGGSGGVFAPVLYVGAMLGGSVAHLLHRPPGPFAAVGMVGVFGGAARVPVATLLMVAEMTGDRRLLVPGALVVATSTLVQTWLAGSLRYPSLYEAQVPAPVHAAGLHGRAPAE